MDFISKVDSQGVRKIPATAPASRRSEGRMALKGLVQNSDLMVLVDNRCQDTREFLFQRHNIGSDDTFDDC